MSMEWSLMLAWCMIESCRKSMWWFEDDVAVVRGMGLLPFAMSCCLRRALAMIPRSSGS